MNKKIISSLLAVSMVASLGVTAFATTLTGNPTAGSTAVEYVGTQQESWTVTIPAKLVPGGATGTVEVEGTWASNRMLDVTAPATVEVTNSIKASDTKTLGVAFAGISKEGDNTVAVSDQTSISVAEISNALFGTWSGNIDFTIEMIDLGSRRYVSNDAELAAAIAEIEAGADIEAIYLSEGTFSAFTMSSVTFDLVGAVNEDGSPATKILQETSFIAEIGGSIGLWHNYNGVVKNIVFEANDNVANNSVGDYDALFVQNGNVTFENCHFVNQGIHFTADVDFVDCVFDGKNHAEKALRYSVVPSGATSTLTNCTIKNYTKSGINVTESAGSLTIDNCELTNCQKSGGYGISIGQIGNLTIRNCTLNCDVKYYPDLTENYSASGNIFGEGYSNKAE